jgi:diguanylate cyclase (GGDEF)-like protein
MAQHDILTGLPNRTLLVDRLEQALARARRHHQMVGVLLIDLDRFKTINDTLGHDVGDELLRAVSDRIARCLRGSDSVGRLGGDEFMIILSDLAGAQESISICEDILRELALPFSIRGHEMFVTCSIGVSIAPNDGDDEQTLIRNADAAMYRAKEQGRNAYQFYTPDMNARAFERLALENSLRRALERNELRVYYQPKVNTATGKITGAEALVRWQHPDMGLVSPAKFIPLAEESGLIVPIGEFVMRTACAQNKAWQDAGFTPITMAVNLSARQLHEAELVATVTGVLKQTGLDAAWLELELTESMLMQQVEGPEKLLRALKDIGIELSIDDFGTGFSSLGYLKRFPIDYLKIDRSFIQDVPGDINDAAIVKAVIAMADSLNLKVVAEGVEKQEQIDFLHNHGCDDVQGFFFSQPVPSEKFTELLQQGGRFPVAG